MGFASPYEVFIYPLIRDGYLFFPLLAWWFALHFTVLHLAPKLIPRFHRLDKKTQNDVAVRIVSVINGTMMFASSPIFLNNLLTRGISPYNDIYKEIPEYHFFRTSIASYFCWDVAVCLYYRWDLSWKIHAFCSLAGTFFLMFPICDDLSSYFGGFFEGTNPILHVSVILRTIAEVCDTSTVSNRRDLRLKATCDRVATVLEYTFGVAFFVIRVVGGTVITYCCVGEFSRALFFDWVKRQPHEPQKSHSEIVLVLITVALAGIQILQYVWFVMIVRKAFGWDKVEIQEDPKPHKVVSPGDKKKK